MTENGNQNRPVRTLTVENFSVVKRAELRFGRITVLIGPQASGKSLLCKLAYFLGGEIIGIAVDALLNRNSWEEFLQTTGREFNSRFSTMGWLRTSFRATFSSQRYFVTLCGVGDPLDPRIEFTFSEDFRQLYVVIGNNLHEQPAFVSATRGDLQQDVWLQISLLLNRKRTQANLYIPSGRAFFADTGKSFSVLQNPDLDQITRRFSEQITWDTRWKVGLLTTGRDVVPEIEKEMQRIAGGVVTVMNGRPFFLSWDGRSLPLPLLSSGTLDVLPMFSVLNYLAFHQEHFYARSIAAKISSLAEISEYSPLIYIEEPEAHVFPETQRDLVNLFARLANDPILSFDWVITTHSPYVLTAFNTLIEAWRAGKKTGKHDQVAAIVPERSWVSEDDFAAYTIHDKVLKPIFEKETKGVEGSGLIDGDYLDSVSDQLGSEFDRLLDIEYAE